MKYNMNKIPVKFKIKNNEWEKTKHFTLEDLLECKIMLSSKEGLPFGIDVEDFIKLILDLNRRVAVP